MNNESTALKAIKIHKTKKWTGLYTQCLVHFYIAANAE